MMQCKRIRICRSGRLLVVLAVLMCGCGGPHAASTADPPTNASLLVSMTQEPTQTIDQFFRALQKNDSRQVALLMTDQARQKLQQQNLKIEIFAENPASLRYQVREVEYVSPQRNGAHVKCWWEKTDPKGKRTTYETIWMLRLQKNGWRIAGAAVPHKPSSPLLFDFESPADALQKQRQLSVQPALEPRDETPLSQGDHVTLRNRGDNAPRAGNLRPASFSVSRE